MKYLNTIFSILLIIAFISCDDTDDIFSDKTLTISNPINAQWSARSAHTMLTYNNALWIFGGDTHQGPFLNDVWTSSDGQNWQEVINDAAWEKRRNHTSVVFDGKMWVIGGRNNDGGFYNDVWYSENGIEWSQATDSASWSPRSGHTTIVYNNEMWLIGGTDGNTTFQDVWKSDNGSTWQQVLPPIGALFSWQGRQEHNSLAFDNKMWIIGGSNSNFSALKDAWFSTDGIVWTLDTDNPGWISSERQVCLGYKDNIWLISEDKPQADQQSIWCFNKLFGWRQTNTESVWGDREDHAGALFNNKMYISGGFKNQALNEVITLE